MDFEKDLNPAQLEAVLHDGGPLLVIAGAGSGKTRTIVYRLAHLASRQGMPPDSILLLTFTRKASQAMLTSGRDGSSEGQPARRDPRGNLPLLRLLGCFAGIAAELGRLRGLHHHGPDRFAEDVHQSRSKDRAWK